MYRMLKHILFTFSVLPLICISCADDTGSRTIDPDPVDTTSKRGGVGKIVFFEHCASCHSVFKNLTGPALNRITQVRDSAWIFTFLTNRKLVRPDAVTKSFKKEFPDFECLVFPDMTKEQVREILRFIEESGHPRY